MKTVVLKKKEKKIHLNCTDDIADILMSSETGDYCYTTKVYNAVIYIDSFFMPDPQMSLGNIVLPLSVRPNYVVKFDVYVHFVGSLYSVLMILHQLMCFDEYLAFVQ